MLILDSGVSTTGPDPGDTWTIRALVARYKLAAATVAAFLAVIVISILVAAFGSTGAVVIRDDTTCTQWGAANPNQQAAYARRYVLEHGPLSDGASAPASVMAAINRGCTQAYGEAVSDTVSVVQAIRGNF